MRFITQLLAASQSGRKLAYCSVQDDGLVAELIELHSLLVDSRATVGTYLVNLIAVINLINFFSGRLQNR
jgi:hypothetical protein